MTTSASHSAESDRRAAGPWTIIGAAGILFTVIGAFEVGVLFYPTALGSPEWEFGTFSALMDTLPLFTLGLGFLCAFALATDRKVLARLVGTVFILALLVILAGALLYATNIPQVLRVGPRSQLQTAIKKALAKTGIQAVIFPVTYIWLGIVSWRWSTHGGRPLA